MQGILVRVGAAMMAEGFSRLEVVRMWVALARAIAAVWNPRGGDGGAGRVRVRYLAQPDRAVVHVRGEPGAFDGDRSGERFVFCLWRGERPGGESRVPTSRPIG